MLGVVDHERGTFQLAISDETYEIEAEGAGSWITMSDTFYFESRTLEYYDLLFDNTPEY